VDSSGLSEELWLSEIKEDRTGSLFPSLLSIEIEQIGAVLSLSEAFSKAVVRINKN
jgi:hypothetical protein